jgi:hypothetical protein
MNPSASAARNWPTDEQAGLLRALLAAPAPDRAALRSWAGSHGPGTQLGTTNGLVPAIHLALKDDGAPVPWLMRAYRDAWFANQRAIHAGLDAAGILRKAGIEAALIKGVPLCLLYHRDPAARPMGDADLVVRAEDVRGADEALRRARCTRLADPPSRALPFVRAIDYRHPLGVGIDLHRYPFRPRSSARAVESFWSRCRERELRGARVLVPDATVLMLLTCWHGRKPEGSMARWPFDAHAIASRGGGDEVDWDALAALAVEAGIAPPVRDALDYLGNQLGLPVPPRALARLASQSAPRGDVRSYDVMTSAPEALGVFDVLATRWEEYAAVRPRPSFQTPFDFIAYAIEANAYYRGRPLSAADLLARIGADWRRWWRD